MQELLPPLKRSLARIGRGIRIKPLQLYVTLGAADDPAAGAQLYGEVNAAVWAVMPVLEQFVDIPDPYIQINVDFDSAKTALRGEAGAKFRVDGTNAPTKLIVALDKKYVGKFANLYKKEGDKLVFVDNVKVDAQGKVIFPVSEQGDYAIMLCEYSDRKGDATNDGITNESDVTAILKDIVAIMSAVNPDMMDYNGDSRANALDASAILIDIAYGVI